MQYIAEKSMQDMEMRPEQDNLPRTSQEERHVLRPGYFLPNLDQMMVEATFKRVDERAHSYAEELMHAFHPEEYSSKDAWIDDIATVSHKLAWKMEQVRQNGEAVLGLSED